MTIFNIKIRIIYCSITIVVLCAPAISDTYLSIADRSGDLKEQITNQFIKAANTTYMYYGEGEQNYGADSFLYSIDLAVAIIKAAPLQKDFYFVDIGAGRGGWVDTVAKRLEKLKDLRDDIRVHIIGLTAQRVTGYENKTEGRFKKYLIDNFNAENFSEELKIKNLDLANKIDLIVSKYTFIHLVDPLGTLVDAYNNLRPDSGMMLLQRFSPNVLNFSEWIDRFLPWTNVQFLVPVHEIDRDINSYVLLKRVNNQEMRIPVTYGPMEKFKDHSSGKFLRASYLLNKDEKVKIQKPKLEKKDRPKIFMRGSADSKALFDWLVLHIPLPAENSKWESIFY